MEPAADAQPLACYFSDAFQDQKSQPADMRLFNRLALAQTVRLRVSLQALRDICMDWTHLGDKKKQSGGHRRQSQTKTGNTNQGRRLRPTYVPDGSRRTTPRGERSFIYLNSFCLKKKRSRSVIKVWQSAPLWGFCLRRTYVKLCLIIQIPAENQKKKQLLFLREGVGRRTEYGPFDACCPAVDTSVAKRSWCVHLSHTCQSAHPPSTPSNGPRWRQKHFPAPPSVSLRRG